MTAAKDFCVKHAIPLVIKIHPDLKGKADWPEQMAVIEGLAEEARAQVGGGRAGSYLGLTHHV